MVRYDPYEDAANRGITVVHSRIKSANGLWIPDQNLIVIKSGMRAVHDRSALAHELAHAELGHRDDRPKHESQADQVAASNLIDLAKCREAMAWVPDVGRLAAELDVSTRLLVAFLRTHRLAG